METRNIDLSSHSNCSNSITSYIAFFKRQTTFFSQFIYKENFKRIYIGIHIFSIFHLVVNAENNCYSLLYMDKVNSYLLNEYQLMLLHVDTNFYLHSKKQSMYRKIHKCVYATTIFFQQNTFYQPILRIPSLLHKRLHTNNSSYSVIQTYSKLTIYV